MPLVPPEWIYPAKSIEVSGGEWEGLEYWSIEVLENLGIWEFSVEDSITCML
jgi:hypothetical protein